MKNITGNSPFKKLYISHLKQVVLQLQLLQVGQRVEGLPLDGSEPIRSIRFIVINNSFLYQVPKGNLSSRDYFSKTLSSRNNKTSPLTLICRGVEIYGSEFFLLSKALTPEG
jgi:hypothetical protein